MTRITSISLITLPAALLATGLALAGCSSDNEPSMSNGDSGSGDTTASNNASTSSGGSSSTSTENAASTESSSGGSSTGTEATNTTGTGVLGDPPCGNTIAGEEIKKGTACTPDDVELCYRTCGPQSVGWKTESCVANAYAEGDCAFPVEDDYSCFAIPETIDASCPAEAPQASTECDVAECTPCNAAGEYLDSGGAAKTGYCVCQPANSEGTRTWTCSSATAWPCPSGNGCT